MAQDKKGSYHRYQKASTDVNAYADGKNPHGFSKVENKLFGLEVEFSNRKRSEYLKNKKNPRVINCLLLQPSSNKNCWRWKK